MQFTLLEKNAQKQQTIQFGKMIVVSMFFEPVVEDHTLKRKKVVNHFKFFSNNLLSDASKAKS